jgi:hypothetical protein
MVVVVLLTELVVLAMPQLHLVAVAVAVAVVVMQVAQVAQVALALLDALLFMENKG